MSTRSADQEVSRAIARMKAGVLAIIFAMLGGGGLFVMTAWLIIKGGPQVGKTLNLLGHFFIGYSVSWPGAFVGLLYGAVTGGIVGWCIGMVYNRIVGIPSASA